MENLNREEVIDQQISEVNKFEEELIRKLTADVRKRANESSTQHNLPSDHVSTNKETDDDSEKTKDCIINSVLGAEAKGKDVVVSGSDSGGSKELKNIDVGKITGSSSSQDRKVMISQVNHSFEKLVGKMKSVVDVMKEPNKSSKQHNLPSVFIKNETIHDYKKKIKELKWEHNNIIQHFNSILGCESPEDVHFVHDHDDQFNQPAEIATEEKGKDFVVAEETSQELNMQGNVKNDVSKITESGASDDLVEE